MEEKYLEQYVISLRRDFHRLPELSMKEFETSKRVCRELEEMGIPYSMAGETGVIAEIRGAAPGPVVVLRGDMDALPIQEDTGLEYASRVPGVMHACGHDAHTAMLLGAAKLLSERKKSLSGTVRLAFEPGEEVGAGARPLIAAGVLEGADSVFAIHVAQNMPAGTVNVQAGPRMCGCGVLILTIKGKSGHGSSPDKGIDVIPAGAAMVSALQTVVSREFGPQDHVVVSVGTFHAGTAPNIIAGEAKLTGSLRYMDPALKDRIPAAVERIIRGTAAAFRVEVEVKCPMVLPPVVNDSACSAVAARAAQGLLEVREMPASTGSDDFAMYVERVPGVYAFLGTGGEYSAHHEKFTLDEGALASGSRLYARYALEYMAQYQKN